SKLLAPLVEPKGRWRRRVIENGDWRAMAAFAAFHARHHQQPGFAAWQRSSQPLSGVPSLRAILALDQLLSSVPPPHEHTGSAGPSPANTATRPAAAPPMVATATLHLGVTRGMNTEPVTLQVRELTQHAAFLGGSGSGK